MGIQYFNRGGAGTNHSKYWMMLIHYDTMEDGQKKTKQNKTKNKNKTKTKTKTKRKQKQKIPHLLFYALKKKKKKKKNLWKYRENRYTNLPTE